MSSDVIRRCCDGNYPSAFCLKFGWFRRNLEWALPDPCVDRRDLGTSGCCQVGKVNPCGSSSDKAAGNLFFWLFTVVVWSLVCGKPGSLGPGIGYCFGACLLWLATSKFRPTFRPGCSDVAVGSMCKPVGSMSKPACPFCIPSEQKFPKLTQTSPPAAIPTTGVVQ